MKYLTSGVEGEDFILSNAWSAVQNELVKVTLYNALEILKQAHSYR